MLKYLTPIFTCIVTTFLFASEQDQKDWVEKRPDGTIVMHRSVYAPYTGQQYVNESFRTKGPKFVMDGIVWQWADAPLPHQATPSAEEIESVVTGAPFELIQAEMIHQQPYSSCGRLKMFFELDVDSSPAVAHGSAAVIGKDVLITAAHNFLPPHFLGKPNHARQKASVVHFEHQLTDNNSFRQGVHISDVATHCFIHPKWFADFDDQYDIAFVFLAESMNLPIEKQEALLTLCVKEGSLEHPVEVVGYPNGQPSMHKTDGITSDNGKDITAVIYHSANTHPGNSGSPIISDKGSLVGVHTMGACPDTGLNRGVRIRDDVMSFLQTCMQSYTALLQNASEKPEPSKAVADVQLAKAEGEAKGKAEGEAKAKIEMVKSMIIQGMDNAIITSISGLPQEQIENIRKSMKSDEQ